MPALAIDLAVLGDTRPLWEAWLEDVTRRAHVDPERLDEELPNWRSMLARFAEDRAPVFLRPDARVAAALRALQADGARLGVFTDAPVELARIALAQLGAARRIEALEAGPGALERLLARLGDFRLIDPGALSYIETFIIRGLNDLPVRFRRR
jgi:phosphoglycolate phosphatase-like HAD superfamily hydrolase